MSAKKITPEDARRRFLKMFEVLGKSAMDSAEWAETLVAVVGNNDEGLVAAVADLQGEIRGLREDFRAAAKAGGVRALFEVLGG